MSLGQGGGDDIDQQQGDFPSWESAWGPPDPVVHHHYHRTGRWAAGAAGTRFAPRLWLRGRPVRGEELTGAQPLKSRNVMELVIELERLSLSAQVLRRDPWKSF